MLNIKSVSETLTHKHHIFLEMYYIIQLLLHHNSTANKKKGRPGSGFYLPSTKVSLWFTDRTTSPIFDESKENQKSFGKISKKQNSGFS